MAQSYQSDTDPATETPAQGTEDRKPGFHYYSGGEVKELENTAVSPLLWAGWTVVIIGAVLYLFLGGALGPNGPFGGFHPTGGSAPVQAQIQQDLIKASYGNETAQAADMTQLTPFLGGESLDTAKQNGATIYQSYCIGCHGPNQDGNGVNASSLNPKPRNLHDGPFMRETMNYQRINTSLHYGVHGTAMPRWENTLREHEIQEVIAYVLSLTWTNPGSADMDTTSAQLGTPHTPPGTPAMPATVDQATPAAPTGATGTLDNPGTVKSPGNSVTGTPGGSTVQGGSVSTSPEPITPTVEGNPAAATSTAPPSQSGQPAGVNPNSVDTNAPDAGTQPGGTR